MKYGIIGMCIIFIILVLISTYKNISPAPLVSLICAYSSVTFFSRYKLNNEKSSLVLGVMLGITVILTTLALILKYIIDYSNKSMFICETNKLLIIRHTNNIHYKKRVIRFFSIY